MKGLIIRQDIAYKQLNEESIGYASCKVNPQGFQRLTIMLSIYQAAVDVVEFGNCSSKEWAGLVMVQVKILTKESYRSSCTGPNTSNTPKRVTTARFSSKGGLNGISKL